jgi:hypothetical protein
MTNITQAAYIAASRNADFWLRQANSDLPYGDLNAMVSAARAEGANVTQVNAMSFLVNNTAWISIYGCVSPA